MKRSKESLSKQAEGVTNPVLALVTYDDAAAAPSAPDDFTKRFQDTKIRDYEQDIELRKRFSWATYGLLCVWLVIVAFLVACSGRSDAVLIALISGATVQVIGLYYIVLRYIFPNRNGAGGNGNEG